MKTTFFAKNLKMLRKKNDITQEQIAQFIGKKKSIVSNYEKGITTPSIECIKIIADIFKVNWYELLDIDLANQTPQTQHIKDTEKQVSNTKVATLRTKLIESLESENALLKAKIKELEQEILELKSKKST